MLCFCYFGTVNVILRLLFCAKDSYEDIRSDDYADMSTSDAIKSLLMFSLLLTIDMNSMGSLMHYQNVVFVPKKDIVLETLFQSYF